MKVLVDINVMLDFLQRREPHFEYAACLIDRILYGQVKAVLAAHGFTTINYFLRKGAADEVAHETLRWILRNFEISPVDSGVLAQALELRFTDFEDSVTSVCAFRGGCSHIVTRNQKDFLASLVPAIGTQQILELADL